MWKNALSSIPFALNAEPLCLYDREYRCCEELFFELVKSCRNITF